MAALTRPLTLPRGRRLQLPGEFSRIRTQGRRRVQGCLILNWMETGGEGGRLGVITSRRIGSAVERNRARRLLRECYRKHQAKLTPATDIVLIARNSINGRGLGEVEQDYLTALRGAQLLEDQT